ncbi:MAG: FAD-dependent monooxygenase [Coxiellaceae bacterium]|nr:FAD-dependent monooxygenase [Coxiellaceae bacterium]
MAEPHNSDILIIGAGLVGTSLACALRDSGLKITLLENHLLDINQPPNLHSRPISLAHSSYSTLQQLGLWDSLAPQACAINNVHVSEQGAFGQLRFNAKDQQLDALGYVVPFDCLRHSLYRQAAEQSNSEIICIEQVESIEQHDNSIELHIKQGIETQRYNTKILIAADGTRSHTRDLLGIGIDQTDHHEMALTATLQLNKQLNTAYERFTDQGTVAILPRLNKTAGMVWTMKPELAEQAKQWNDQELLQQVQSIIGYRVGRIQSIKANARYPLITTVAKQQYTGRALLLGNSAHTFYPIAAQGFNLSLRDVSALADLLMQNSPDCCTQVFDEYKKRRKDDQAKVQRLISCTAKAFDLSLPCAKPLRGASLLAVACLPPLKKRLARRTLGLSGQVKNLIAGLQHDTTQ